MKCPKCTERLRITHTMGAGERGQTRAMLCPKCGQRFTEVSLVHENNGLGDGARALATAIRQGRISVIRRSKNPAPSKFDNHAPPV